MAEHFLLRNIFAGPRSAYDEAAIGAGETVLLARLVPWYDIHRHYYLSIHMNKLYTNRNNHTDGKIK